MRLTELKPQFYRYLPGAWHAVETLAEADGIWFICPVCFATNGHGVLCWFQERGVPPEEKPGPGRWSVSGTDYSDLSLVPSIHLTGPGCGWHGYVTNGEVT